MLRGKKILLCVTGGIAVFKAAALTSKLTQAGAEVKVMMTESAAKFVQPLTFQVLSRNEVYIDTFKEDKPKVIAHIDVADWADLIIVAPATANIIGKMANGIADNMIVTTLLATTAPVWVAPAMNVHMYNHLAVQENLKKIVNFGYRLIEPEEGFLACGYVGKGRLEEPEAIVDHLINYFNNKNKEGLLSGKKVVITAGPTREKVDPVRFFTNYSTGKMGYALAEEAVKLGAEVVLISGPTQLEKPDQLSFLPVESAEQMYDAVISHYHDADVVIKAAAVADYRPKETHLNKMKKQEGNLHLELERTTDILQQLGKEKTNQILVGFAAETNDLEDNAMKKLVKKNADFIIANNITEAGSGFGTETNSVTIFKSKGEAIKLPLMSKSEVAKKILEEVSERLKEDK